MRKALSHRIFIRFLIAWVTFPLTLLLVASGTQGQNVSKSKQGDVDRVLATVNGNSITQREVEHYLVTQFPGREFSGQSRQVAVQAALEHLVNRRIVFEFLVEKKYAPGRSRIEAHLDQIREQAKARGQSLADIARERNISLEHFRFEAAWKLGWSRYLELKLTEASIEAFFKENRARYDGTQWDVSQLFLPSGTEENDSSNSALKQLQTVRKSILSGAITWVEAVKTTSKAPSRKKEGRVGWIGYEGPMDRSFTEQVVGLKPGEISEPFVTRFGIHLVRCNEIKPGKMDLGDNYQVVKQAAMKSRFEAIVEYQKPKVDLEIETQQ